MTRECTLVEEDRTRSDLAELGLKLGLIVMVLVLGGVALAQTAAPAAVALTPAEMKWQSQGGLAAPGMEQINLVGDPAKPGPYTLRLKFPKGFRIEAHSHPDFREVTILSGTFATGYGEKFDPAGLKILPAGSFYTEPANVPHYIEIKEEVVLQVSGMGPSGRKFVDRPAGIRNVALGIIITSEKPQYREAIQNAHDLVVGHILPRIARINWDPQTQVN